jgi:outer membrane lipoprotein SlyB
MKTASKTHPMIIVAAASVTVLSLAGVASLAGWMPGRGEASTMPSPLAVSAPATTAGPTTLAIPSGSTITVKPKTETRVASNRAPRPLEPTAANVPPPQAGYTRVANASTQRVNTANDNGIYVENARPAVNQPPAPAICQSCGTIQSVQEISNKGEGTGLGAIAGGVLGGLLGSQIGGGNGKKAMAVVGAAGGAFAGHEVEKRVRGETQYQITVRFDDGNTRTYTETTATQMQSGDRVRLENGRLVML